MPSDEVLYRGGVDLFVFGKARAPKGRPAAFVKVRISCRGFQCQILAFGDRVWTKRGRQFVATEPRPFVEMPLTIQNAYGGKVHWDGLEIPFPENPEGKGFCFEEKDAVDLPLPNLEDPSRMIKTWEDRPAPVGVGLCPPFFGPRMRDSVVFSKEGALTKLRPTLFNAAFPAMVAPSVEPEDTLAIEGVSADGPLLVKIPPLPLKMRLTMGETVAERPLRIDQVGIQVDKGQGLHHVPLPIPLYDESATAPCVRAACRRRGKLGHMFFCVLKQWHPMVGIDYHTANPPHLRRLFHLPLTPLQCSSLGPASHANTRPRR